MLARGYASLADYVVERTGKAVALISMEQLDEALAEQVLRRMRHPESARKFSARLYDASRYHAAVLSLAAGVPQVAVHHDTRLSTLYEDLGLKEKWFRDPGPAEGLASICTALELFKWLQKRVDMLLANPGLQKEPLSRGYAEHLALARQNRKLLGEFIADRGLCPDLSDMDGGAGWVA
jgi:hypothetical protein